MRIREERVVNMHLLHSNILPLRVKDKDKEFFEYFRNALSESDSLEIAVGYASKGALNELRELIELHHIKKVNIAIGMYYLEGMPEGMYHAALELDTFLKQKDIGEIRLTHVFKYHGKLYAFYKGEQPVAGIVGSNNLGSIKLEASNFRQYEISAVTEKREEIVEISDFIHQILEPKCSINIQDAKDISLIREINRALVGQEYVDKITQDEVEAYREKLTGTSFEIPLKVPFDESDPKMRGSNINVCYAKGRKRVWWEIEMVVSKKIKELPGYPEWKKPFMAVTDDGWKFKAWTCGGSDGRPDKNKNLYSKDDLKIMGRWIKGRLVAAGLVEPVNNVEKDNKGRGIITKKILQKYGRDTISLTKTSLTTIDEDGTVLEVWMLSFLPESRKMEEFI